MTYTLMLNLNEPETTGLEVLICLYNENKNKVDKHKQELIEKLIKKYNTSLYVMLLNIGKDLEKVKKINGE